MKLSENFSLFPITSAILLCGIVIALVLLAPVSSAESMNYEINRLISSVGRNGCNFIRNGEKYRGKAARDHLRSKRKLNEQLISTTEEFIEKIASTSAATGEPYLIRCLSQEERTVSEWFTTQLEKTVLLANKMKTTHNESIELT
ncbi:MAG: DUF5329 family protein [Proteobacteria bacterium]|nr:DUF5329 family protein [Pseudomonadota bacterium]MDA1290239.1 DUF5329 family protein [Pseudomonadota bacterium]